MYFISSVGSKSSLMAAEFFVCEECFYDHRTNSEFVACPHPSKVVKCTWNVRKQWCETTNLYIRKIPSKLLTNQNVKKVCICNPHQRYCRREKCTYAHGTAEKNAWQKELDISRQGGRGLGSASMSGSGSASVSSLRASQTAFVGVSGEESETSSCAKRRKLDDKRESEESDLADNTAGLDPGNTTMNTDTIFPDRPPGSKVLPLLCIFGCP